MNADYWLDTAVEKIRFVPDRKAVRQELSDHIEDRKAALLEKGDLSNYQAEQQAVAAMGDPGELAEALARVHRPWWGRLWRLSQWLLALCVLWTAVTLWSAWRNADWPFWGISRPDFPDAAGVVYTTYYGQDRQALAAWEIEGSVRRGGYRFTVPNVWLETWTSDPQDGTPARECYELNICLRASTWRFWEPASGSQFLILDNVVTDSRGVRYAYDRDEESADYASLFCWTYGDSFSTWYQVMLDLPDPEAAPDWVEIPVGMSGFTLRLDIKGGKVS